jgi:hypothetical protein
MASLKLAATDCSAATLSEFNWEELPVASRVSSDLPQETKTVDARAKDQRAELRFIKGSPVSLQGVFRGSFPSLATKVLSDDCFCNHLFFLNSCNIYIILKNTNNKTLFLQINGRNYM